MQSSGSVCVVVHPHTLGVPPPPQVWGELQPPQLTTCRERPHESVPNTLPQLAPSCWQKARSLSDVQPQAFEMPPPPQVVLVPQVPQLATFLGFPQRSVPLSAPQDAPRRVQKAESDSEQEHAPAEQVELPTQVPQLGTER